MAFPSSSVSPDHISADPATPPFLVDRREAARLLSLSERTVFTLTKSGNLPAKRIGRNVRYALDQLRAWIAQSGTIATTFALAV